MSDAFSRSVRYLLLLAAVAGSGCAHVSVDADGTRHITGLLRLTLPPAPDAMGADVVKVQALGVLVVNHAVAGSSVVVGYGSSSITAVKNDALVRLPAPSP